MLQIRRYDEPPAQLREELAAALRAFNDARSPHHRDARTPEHAARTLDLFVLDDDGRLRAGLVGQLVWAWTGRGWLFVDKLWVDETLRGQDYGSRPRRVGGAVSSTEPRLAGASASGEAVAYRTDAAPGADETLTVRGTSDRLRERRQAGLLGTPTAGAKP
jgi:hypothetical protein